tara:strand:- start:140 stop:1990 length:1851 start_codon:yes stop_codon:yes gene_type:complete
MEINGFKILEYNIYKIKEGDKLAVCPKCSHERKPKNQKVKCASVFWDTGLLQCNHCKERIQMHSFVKNETKTLKIYSKPKEKPKALLSDLMVDYFAGQRDISKDTLTALKVSESSKWMPKAGKEINVIEFNYYLFGELINTKSRGKNKDFRFEKDCELILYNIDSIIGEKEAVLVEGEPDALSYHDCGVKNVASVPNGFTIPKADGSSTIQCSYLDDYYGILEPIEKFYLAFDNDVAGIEGKKEFIRRLGAEKCFIVDFKDCKDANDYKLKYGGEALKKTISDAKQVPLEGIINISDVDKELNDFWINGASRGMTIDLPGFDEMASFVYKQHTLLVSAPGSGKSDLLDHITSKLAIKYGCKVGVCSTENKPEIFHFDKIFKKIHGIRPNKFNYDSQEVKDCKEFINNNFFHVDVNGRYYLEDVLKKFAELVTRKGVRVFVLDPFNKINLKNFSKSDINAYTAEYHQILDAFEQKYDCHIFLVVHPVKLPNKEGSTKTFIMPNAYNIKGGGEHFDMSYNIIGMVRDYELNMVHIRTLKWKFQHLGTTGQDTWVGWNINNGRYTAPNTPFDEAQQEMANITWNNNSWISKEITTEKLESAMLPNEDFENEDLIGECPF